EGTQVDVSLYGSQIALQAWEIDTESMTGQVSGRSGQGHPLITPRGVWRSFETADGWLVVGGVNAARFRGLCELLGVPELAETYGDDANRAANAANIIAALEPCFRQQPTAHW